ncbi:hypothetical protein TKK_0008685 [Trichogramma kaykai]
MPCCTSVSEVNLRCTKKISDAARFQIFRALQCVTPESNKLYRCIESSAKRFILDDDDCTLDYARVKDRPKCGRREDSSEASEWSLFCRMFKKQCPYTEIELRAFAKVILQALNEKLAENVKDCPEDDRTITSEGTKYEIVVFSDPEDSTCYCSASDVKSSSAGTDTCDCSSARTEDLTCKERHELRGACICRPNPIKFRHFWVGSKDDLEDDEDPNKQPCELFKLDYMGASDEIGKWGAFLDLVNRVLQHRDLKLLEISKRMSHAQNVEIVCDGESCQRKYSFRHLNRYNFIEFFGFSKICREMMKWSSCIAKRWQRITSNPHLIIHLPSLGYPCPLRCKIRGQFKSLQNIQIGRLGWLVNEQAQVVYVHPGKSNSETSCVLQNFIKLARPDCDLSRLWIITNDDNECFCEEVDEKYRSGCETLFYTPDVYRRVRRLTAGRHGFIIPGVLTKTDFFIACELMTPVMGPCLKSQERLSNKSYVMSLLAEANIPHPPFEIVETFVELCERMSAMISGLKRRRSSSHGLAKGKARETRWILRVNSGFCGNQSASVVLSGSIYDVAEEVLPYYLADLLPKKLRVNKLAYKSAFEYFNDLERYGGVVTLSPSSNYRTISLGGFIEHDTAKARLRTSAEVVQMRLDRDSDHPLAKNCKSDVGYIIPQTSLSEPTIERLVDKLGQVLVLEQFIGFFGVDLVVFDPDDWLDNEDLNYWVVDFDPYYTDLISFDDWRRFCLNTPYITSDTQIELECIDNVPVVTKKKFKPETVDRFVICSGKLFIEGLSECPMHFFEEVFLHSNIAYSPKAKIGCMICPISNSKRNYLLFSIYRTKDQALQYFLQALKALYFASVKATKSRGGSKRSKSNLLDLIYDVKEAYNIVDCHFIAKRETNRTSKRKRRKEVNERRPCNACNFDELHAVSKHSAF